MNLEENPQPPDRPEELGGDHEHPAGKEDENASPPDGNDALLMDYDALANAGDTDLSVENPAITVGLIGGQGKDDMRGLDISQYTGPASKASNDFEDPPGTEYGTGPGNGLDPQTGVDDTEWENPHPENDSF